MLCIKKMFATKLRAKLFCLRRKTTLSYSSFGRQRIEIVKENKNNLEIEKERDGLV